MNATPHGNADRPITCQAIVVLAVRVFTGAFLIYGSIDNVLSAERMTEFVEFLRSFGFPAPHLLAPLSVYVQFIGGGFLVAGLFTRWTAWILAFNFVVALVMVDRLSPQGLRGLWPAGALVLICLDLACRGAGPLSVDDRLGRTIRGLHPPAP